ncbi:MAG: hypothetical protein ACQETI_06005 [Halobacteriota archaeon]
MAQFVSLVESGERCTRRRIHVSLYPNTPDEEAAVASDADIVDALGTALQSLLEHDAITYFELERFEGDEGSYPGLTYAESGFIGDFLDWLEDPEVNGTGTNLYNRLGVHLLVYRNDDQPCDYSHANAEYADDCSGGTNPSAFDRGVAAYTPVGCTETDAVDLQKNSAIHEVLHPFISHKHPAVESLIDCDNSVESCNIAEHALGEIRDGEVTPMLTYHVDDVANRGVCRGDGTDPTGYRTSLTVCTKDAVASTSTDCTAQPLPEDCAR